MPTQFYSEHGEDRWIAENIFLPRWGALPPWGTYVDLGCAHPQRYSNTAFLRDLGWRGLAVDGNRDYWQHWGPEMAGSTHFVHAVIGNGEDVPFRIEENSALSRIGEGGQMVPSRTLQSILDEYQVGRIDVLSLDLEGSEFDAIQTFNLKLHQPWIIVAEFNTAGLGEDDRLRRLLAKTNRYDMVHATVSNQIFQLRTPEAFPPRTP